MGWYGDTQECPKCNSSEAMIMYHNDLLDDMYLICPKCGLHVFCKRRKWVVTKSFIDNRSIGVNLDDEDIQDLYEKHEKNKTDEDNIFPEGTAFDW